MKIVKGEGGSKRWLVLTNKRVEIFFNKINENVLLGADDAGEKWICI